MDRAETGWSGMDWIGLAQDKIRKSGELLCIQ
jgi:hypothetical protein